MSISGKTIVTGLLGWPVEHSLSPRMHNSAFEHLGLDYCYVTFPVRPENLKEAVSGVRALGMAGVNVTVPHKESVIQYLDAVSDEARAIGAVNTIVNKDGKLIGYNTDGRGFMQSLAEEGIAVNEKDILLIGAGGASKAVSYYLSEKASKLFIFDVDKTKENALMEYLTGLGRNVFEPESLSMAQGMDIIINATPLGLKESDPLPIDKGLIIRSTTVVDLIYKETPLLGEAKKRGCKTMDGMGMLLWQGVFAFELWTGMRPPVEVMRKALAGV